MNKNACQNQPQFNFLVGILPPVIFRSLAVLAMLAWATPTVHAQSISILVNGYNDVPLTQTATTGSVSLTYERSIPPTTVLSTGLASYGGFTGRTESRNLGGQPTEVGNGVAQGNSTDIYTIDAPGRTGQPGVLTFTLQTTGTLLATTERPTGVGGDTSRASVSLSVYLNSGQQILNCRKTLDVRGGTFVTGPPFFNQAVTLTAGFTFGTPFALGIVFSTQAETFDSFAEHCVADASTYWNGITSVTDSNGTPVSGYTVASASGTNYQPPIGPPPPVLWAAGRDLLANERPDRPAEANAINETVPEWSYGYRTTAVSTALTLFPPGIHVNNADGTEGWSGAAEGILVVNTKSEPIILNGGFGNLKPLYPKQVLMHPSASNNFIVARWTAPADADYRFVARWVDLDNHGGNGGTAHLVINGTEEFEQNFESTPVLAGKARLRARTLSIHAGDLVDFVLGSRGENTFDTTGFNAVVYRVPKVTITSPVGATTFTEEQDIVVSVQVEHFEAVQKVSLRVDEETVTNDFQAPYEFNLRLGSGTHRITAVATDSRNARGISPAVEILVTEGGSSGAGTARERSGQGASETVPAGSGGRLFYSSRSGGWEEPSTWEDGSSGVPGPNDHAVINVGHSVGLRADTEVKHLNVNGRIARDAVAPPTLTVNGNLYANNEIIGALTLVIGPRGKFFNIAGFAILNDVAIINNGAVVITGDQFQGAGCTLINNGQLIVGPPPGLDQFVKLPLNNFTNHGQASIAENGQLISNSSTLVSGNLALSTSSPAISENGAGLIGNDGGTLIGNDGGTLIGIDGGTLVGNDGASLIGPDGNRLVGLDGGSLITDNGAGLIGIDGGTLTGTGEIRGNLVNRGGFILPGNSPGGILINGNYTQESAATLLLEIGGTRTTPFEYDIFQVAGTANLGGKLIVRTINGFTPAPSDVLSPLLYTSHTGSFASVSSNAQITLGPDGAQISVSGPNPPAPKALNISTRMRVETGDNALIGGFIVTGTQPKRVIIRGIGPSLPVSGALADPRLELDGGAVTNDNWRTGGQEAEIIATTIPPSNDLESAIIATLNPGPHTAILRGNGNTTGVGLVEVYDLESGAPAQLANISTRGQVQTGDNVMIGGFIIGGDYPARVLIRAIGPSLPVSGALQDPTLELVDSNGNRISNDNWRATQESEIVATTIPPTNEKEAAIVATLVPGSYTAIVRGKDDTVGVALVESYNLQ